MGFKGKGIVGRGGEGARGRLGDEENMQRTEGMGHRAWSIGHGV